MRATASIAGGCRAAFRFTAGLAALVLAGCGLADYPFLYPPDAAYLEGDVLTFQNDVRNDPSVFFGFRLMYRMLPSAVASEDAAASADALADDLPTTIYGSMRAIGFRDLYINGDQEIVIDQQDRDERFSIKLDFTGAVNETGHATIGLSELSPLVGTSPDLTTSQKLRRAITDNPGFDPAGLNYTEDFEGEVEGTIYLLIYVLSFGYDAAFRNVFSAPQRFIGAVSHIELPLP